MNANRSYSNVNTIKQWLANAALPVWSHQGLDTRYGGFYECLNFDGTPVYGQPKRMRVQGRQLYTYSHAALLGWDSGSLETARCGFEFLVDHYWHPDGGWIFSVNEDGSALDKERESYEQAFALFGFAWYYRASKDDRVLPWLEKSLTFLDRIADGTHGGYRESIPDKLPRRQNPHMHLLEAFIALYETFNESTYLDRAHAIVDLAQCHFFEGNAICLGEYFKDDWALASGEPGQILEPGHHFEWTWLLNKYALVSGRHEVRSIAQALFDVAEQQGTQATTGLAYDEIRRDGTVSNAAKRLWPQTEALKAHLVYDDIKDGIDLRHDQLVEQLFNFYLNAEGTWQDKLDADNNGIDTSAPASTMYHLFVSFDEYLKRAAGDYRL